MGRVMVIIISLAVLGSILNVGTIGELAIAMVGKGQDLWLITPKEAAMAPAKESGLEGEIPVAAESEMGPKIEVIKPTQGASAKPPVEIDIKFVAKSSPVDPASLTVSVVKLINIDITDRVRTYVTASGIHVPAAQLPSGKHTVRISIADQDGLRSVKDVTFEVLDSKS
ncbi:MAG: hypothetical protein U0223_00215 [Nitrospira sp.]|nr:hypothetical protein [Nitrospira sp.]